MSENPYVQFYTSDFLAGTSGLTASTKGVYITLLCQMYEMETPLSQSWGTLARRCGCTLAAFKKAISDLQDDGKIQVTDAGLWSEKCDKHISLRHERRDSAKAAAEKRWQKDKQKQWKGDAPASTAQCQPEPEPYSNGLGKPKPSAIDTLRGFDDFWELWPSKKNKDNARKAWKKISIDERREAFKAIRDGWFERWRQGSPDANPIHASTFLNSKRWEDQAQPQFKAIPGGRTNDQSSNSPDRLRRVVSAAAAGTSGQDWG